MHCQGNRKKFRKVLDKNVGAKGNTAIAANSRVCMVASNHKRTAAGRKDKSQVNV
jgi:hypothetical protein